jgi:hypothetical protein
MWPEARAKRYPYHSGTKCCSVVFKQLVIRPFWPISISETDHLFTKQLLCQLSYVGVL